MKIKEKINNILIDLMIKYLSIVEMNDLKF